MLKLTSDSSMFVLDDAEVWFFTLKHLKKKKKLKVTNRLHTDRSQVLTLTDDY